MYLDSAEVRIGHRFSGTGVVDSVSHNVGTVNPEPRSSDGECAVYIHLIDY